MDLGKEHAHNHQVDAQMTDACVEREVVGALNNAEQKATPLQRVRRRYVVTQLRGRHVLVRDRDEFDLGGVGDGAPNDVVGIRVLEPTAVGVVPAKMRVDRISHGANVAPTGDLPAEDHHPGHLETTCRVVGVAAKVLGLLIAGRNRHSPARAGR